MAIIQCSESCSIARSHGLDEALVSRNHEFFPAVPPTSLSAPSRQRLRHQAIIVTRSTQIARSQQVNQIPAARRLESNRLRSEFRSMQRVRGSWCPGFIRWRDLFDAIANRVLPGPKTGNPANCGRNRTRAWRTHGLFSRRGGLERKCRV